MARQIQLNISLEPVSDYDPESQTYIFYYKQFPEAFAEGRSIEEAENNLIPTLELMWKERPLELESRLRPFLNDAHMFNTKIVSA